jgi:phosphotransferase system HPr (HPr) family protein
VVHASSEPVAFKRATLPARVALHARPAAVLVREASQVSAVVEVAANGRRANAKSILEVLALGAEGGTALELSASGADAVEAVERLAALVAELA